MSLISENYQEKKLNKYKINIETKYIEGNKIKVRNTNNSVNDDVSNGIRCEKLYYQDNKLIHKEKTFDSRIEYTFISKELENKEYTCSNCGMHSKLKNFLSGCPYCRTSYNIDYTDKALGVKYHYDRVLQSNVYKIITGIIDIIISIFLCYVVIYNTSRTFNEYDIAKIFIYGFILALILYYFFYIIDAYIVLTPIKIYKDKMNQRQIDFFNRTNISKKAFFNNLNYELGKYYYLKDDIIDYDILDYMEFEEYTKDNKMYVKVKVNLRLIIIKDNKIKSKYIKKSFIMMKNDKVLSLKKDINIIKCATCGADIDVTLGKCSYCNNEINYFQEWILKG